MSDKQRINIRDFALYFAFASAIDFFARTEISRKHLFRCLCRPQRNIVCKTGVILRDNGRESCILIFSLLPSAAELSHPITIKANIKFHNKIENDNCHVFALRVRNEKFFATLFYMRCFNERRNV